jgi:hypothetical protein
MNSSSEKTSLKLPISESESPENLLGAFSERSSLYPGNDANHPTTSAATQKTQIKTPKSQSPLEKKVKPSP